MARADLLPVFEAVGLPVTMGPWNMDEIVPELFIEYHMEGDNNKAADNIAYKKIDRWSISVYGSSKNMSEFYQACSDLEDALEANKIFAYRSGDLFPGDDRVFAEFTFSLKR